MDERRTSPVELLWDLVFAFAVTQVTTLLRQFVGPESPQGDQYIWAFFAITNVYVLVDQSLDPAMYQLLLEYNECSLDVQDAAAD